MEVQPCLFLLASLHSQGCHLCCLCSKLIFFNRSRVYCSKSSYAHPASQKKLVSGLLIQVISPEVLQESTTMLRPKVSIVSVVRKFVGHPPQQECPINLASLFFPFACNERSLDHQFLLFFPHEVSHHKVRKVTDPDF